MRAFKSYPKIAGPVLQKAFVGTQAILAKHTLKNNPVPWVTGNLLQSFRFKVGQLESRWFPTANYAPFVEFGRGFVYPKGKALKFSVGGGGKYVTSKTSGKKYYKSGQSNTIFAKYARPSKPNPFMQAIADNSVPDVTRMFLEAEKIINDEIAKQTNIR